MQRNENNGLFEKAMHVGQRLVGRRGEASRLKTTASHAVEDALTKAKRFGRRRRYAADELMEDAAHRVKRDPLRSIALGFSLGLSLGALAVWGTKRGSD
jgi:ElaB/YqjD/DUF883 family membrane-anchored ribosome-binding protein